MRYKKLNEMGLWQDSSYFHMISLASVCVPSLIYSFKLLELMPVCLNSSKMTLFIDGNLFM